jgi:hypothetical protein
MPLPFPDALQEFRLSTSAQDASNGGNFGGGCGRSNAIRIPTAFTGICLNFSATRI